MEKKDAMKSITFILSGSLLMIFNAVGDNWRAVLLAIFGIILMFIGLGKLKKVLDKAGKSAVMLLIIALVIHALGCLFALIPLVGSKVGSIFFLLAFLSQLIGFVLLRSSISIGQNGKTGVILLIVAMLFGIIASIFGIIPLMGLISSIFALIAIIFVFFGWLKIQDGLGESIN